MDGRVKVKSRGRRSLVKRSNTEAAGYRFRCLLHDLP